MSLRTSGEPVRLSAQDAERFRLAKECFGRGEHERAAGVLEGLLQANPEFARGWFLLGYTQGVRGRYELAVECLERAVSLAQDDAEFRFYLAKAYASAGRRSEAVGALRDTLERAPEHASAHTELGLHLHALGEVDAAIGHHLEATRLAPSSARGFNALGMALRGAHRPQDAEAAFSAACRLDPDDVKTLRNLGLALKSQGKWDHAIEVLQRGLERSPEDPEMLVALGVTLARAERGPQAIEILRRAVAIDPSDPISLGWLIREQEQECDWVGIKELTQAARSLLHSAGKTIHPFVWLSRSNSRHEQRLAADRWAETVLAKLPPREGPAIAAGARQRIRIGYVSADFHEHATAYLLADVIESHDRREFEVYGYSIGSTRTGAMRERLAGAFDAFFDVASQSDADTAARMRRDGIELLIDLKGYTQHARPELIARRPAPVIVNYLGYPGTLGSGMADYIVGDEMVTPLEAAPEFAEKIVILPDSYQPNDPQRHIGDTLARESYGLPRSALVLCNFNQTYKLSPEIFGLWWEVLRAVPGAVLWLLGSRPGAMAKLRRELASKGVRPERLIAAPRVELAAHLGRLRCADLALDTFPYASHTTASDALWAGVPLVALAGETFASRVSASLLKAVGLTELVTWSFEEHRVLLLALATRPERLAQLRAKLAGALAGAPLFDSALYTRNFESALHIMSQRARAGKPPEHIVVR